MLERQQAAVRRRRGLGVREMTRRLCVTASTSSRALRRNVRPHDHEVYVLGHADRHVEQTRRTPGSKCSATTPSPRP